MKPVAALLALAAALLVLAGCSARPASPETSGTHTIGDGREYVLTVPQNLGPGAALVVVLHGGFGSAAQAQESYGWDQLAASEGFIVAYPDGLGRAWNVGDGCCGKSGEENVDDVGFIGAVVAEIVSTADVDPDRVFVSGMSNGAMMSYRLACDTTLFAAIAPVSGTLVGECDNPAPTSVLAIHGEADENVRLDGEPGTGAENIDGAPVGEVVDSWRVINGCDAPVVKADPPVTTSTATCADDRAVELITIAEAGHQWPGSVQTPAQERLSDEPSTALDATATIWQFFEAHPRP